VSIDLSATASLLVRAPFEEGDEKAVVETVPVDLLLQRWVHEIPRVVERYGVP
jgi:hypothetical protein